MKEVALSKQTGEAAALPWDEAAFDPPLLEAGNAALRWIGPFISLGIFGAVLYQLRGLQIAQVAAMLPRSPLFWLAFAAYYLAAPLFDLLIFRRLWNLPLGAGLSAQAYPHHHRHRVCTWRHHHRVCRWR